LTSLQREDLHVGTGAHVRVIGKGRKERCTPLSKNTRAVLTAWVREPPLVASQPLFPNARGSRLSSRGVQYLLAKHAAVASEVCQSLKHKRVSPHVLRHYLPFLTMSRDFERLIRHRGSSVFVRRRARAITRHSQAATVR
jgi:site-specific recombinase XerC